MALPPTNRLSLSATRFAIGMPPWNGTVSTPFRWDELDDVEPNDLTIATVPARYAELGDLHAGIDDAVFDIAPLLEWADRDEAEGVELEA